MITLPLESFFPMHFVCVHTHWAKSQTVQTLACVNWTNSRRLVCALCRQSFCVEKWFCNSGHNAMNCTLSLPYATGLHILYVSKSSENSSDTDIRSMQFLFVIYIYQHLVRHMISIAYGSHFTFRKCIFNWPITNDATQVQCNWILVFSHWFWAIAIHYSDNRVPDMNEGIVSSFRIF